MSDNEEPIRKQPGKGKFEPRSKQRNSEALSAVPTREHPLWPKFEAWAKEHIPDLQWPLWWECFLAGAQASREFEVNPPPLRPGMTIEEVVAEGHSVGINPSKGVIVVDGKEMPIAEEMRWTNEIYKPGGDSAIPKVD